LHGSLRKSLSRFDLKSGKNQFSLFSLAEIPCREKFWFLT
jgi:hypothetical protein